MTGSRRVSRPPFPERRRRRQPSQRLARTPRTVDSTVNNDEPHVRSSFITMDVCWYCVPAMTRSQILADSGTNPNCQFRTRPTSFCYPFSGGYRNTARAVESRCRHSRRIKEIQ